MAVLDCRADTALATLTAKRLRNEKSRRGILALRRSGARAAQAANRRLLVRRLAPYSSQNTDDPAGAGCRRA